MAAIVLFGYPVLREIARPVEVFDKKLMRLLDRMAKTLDSRRDGAALAAPQVGSGCRVILINYEDECLALVNPEIVEGDGYEVDFEGCLSLPGVSGKVPRLTRVKVRAFDPEGKPVELERTGRMARCLQHEIDHLDGILYIDRMEDELLFENDGGRTISRAEVLAKAGNPPVPVHPLKQGSGLSLSELGSDDRRIASLAALAERIWHGHYDAITSPAQVSYMLEHFQSVPAMEAQMREGMRYLVAEIAGKLVGYAGIKAEADHLFLSKFYVDADLRCQGIGKALLARVCAAARELGLGCVRLTVNRGNAVALAAYDRLGFVRIASQVSDIGGGFVMDDHVLELRLG